MTIQYKKWADLTKQQTREAQRKGLFIGYDLREIQGLLFGVENGKVKSLRDNNLLADVFPKGK